MRELKGFEHSQAAAGQLMERLASLWVSCADTTTFWDVFSGVGENGLEAKANERGGLVFMGQGRELLNLFPI